MCAWVSQAAPCKNRSKAPSTSWPNNQKTGVANDHQPKITAKMQSLRTESSPFFVGKSWKRHILNSKSVLNYIQAFTIHLPSILMTCWWHFDGKWIVSDRDHHSPGRLRSCLEASPRRTRSEQWCNLIRDSFGKIIDDICITVYWCILYIHSLQEQIWSIWGLTFSPHFQKRKGISIDFSSKKRAVPALPTVETNHLIIIEFAYKKGQLIAPSRGHHISWIGQGMTGNSWWEWLHRLHTAVASGGCRSGHWESLGDWCSREPGGACRPHDPARRVYVDLWNRAQYVY